MGWQVLMLVHGCQCHATGKSPREGYKDSCMWTWRVFLGDEEWRLERAVDVEKYTEAEAEIGLDQEETMLSSTILCSFAYSDCVESHLTMSTLHLVRFTFVS